MTDIKPFSTTAARELARMPVNPFWADQMRQTLLWACDIIDVANAALEPGRAIGGDEHG